MPRHSLKTSDPEEVKARIIAAGNAHPKGRDLPRNGRDLLNLIEVTLRPLARAKERRPRDRAAYEKAIGRAVRIFGELEAIAKEFPDLALHAARILRGDLLSMKARAGSTLSPSQAAVHFLVGKMSEHKIPKAEAFSLLAVLLPAFAGELFPWNMKQVRLNAQKVRDLYDKAAKKLKPARKRKTPRKP